jgi:hypothetical protein
VIALSRLAFCAALCELDFMKKEVALARLKPLEHRLRQQGVSALYLFGSTARGEEDDESDLDLLFEYLPDCGFRVFDQAGLQEELSEYLKTKVDFIPRKGLKDKLRQRIEADLVRVF